MSARRTGSFSPEPPPVGAGERQDRLQVFTFWGGAGSPGRTTLAINWGALLGSAARTIVVDLDLTGAALAAHLDDTAGETGRRARVSPNLVQLASTNPETAEAWTRELERTVAPLGPFSPHGFFLRGVPPGSAPGCSGTKRCGRRCSSSTPGRGSTIATC